MCFALSLKSFVQNSNVLVRLNTDPFHFWYTSDATKNHLNLMQSLFRLQLKLQHERYNSSEVIVTKHGPSPKWRTAAHFQIATAVPKGLSHNEKTHIISPKYSDVERQQLHGYDSQYTLQAVHSMGNGQVVVSKLLGLLISLVADHYRPTLHVKTYACTYTCIRRCAHVSMHSCAQHKRLTNT